MCPSVFLQDFSIRTYLEQGENVHERKRFRLVANIFGKFGGPKKGLGPHAAPGTSERS